MKTFDELHVLYAFQGDFVAGVYYHPNAAAIVTKQEELEAMKAGFSFETVVYDRRLPPVKAAPAPVIEAQPEPTPEAAPEQAIEPTEEVEQ